MPSLSQEITDLVAGDDWTFTRTIGSIPVGQLLQKVWLTIKESETDADVDALAQVSVTTNATASGQITDTGADGTGGATINVPAATTALLSGGQLYHYDIQVQTDASLLYTPEKGTLTPVAGITRATS